VPTPVSRTTGRSTRLPMTRARRLAVTEHEMKATGKDPADDNAAHMESPDRAVVVYLAPRAARCLFGRPLAAHTVLLDQNGVEFARFDSGTGSTSRREPPARTSAAP
jgi:hypothetical protein